MGKVVSRKKYEYYEYVTAIMISIGMTFFMLGSGEEKSHNNVTTFSGVILLVAYLIFDSFTSNWQGALFTQFHMSSVQMMCGVSLFSCLFTAVSLLQQGGFIHSLQFMMNVIFLYYFLHHHLFFILINIKNFFLVLQVCVWLPVIIYLLCCGSVFYILHDIKFWSSCFCYNNDHQTGKILMTISYFHCFTDLYLPQFQLIFVK